MRKLEAYHKPDGRVIRARDGLTLGKLIERQDGWYFLPHFQRKPSRRGWPTPQKALNSYSITLGDEPVTPPTRIWPKGFSNA